MSDRRPERHLVPVLQALLVTFLWSTSWVLIKLGLSSLPPITFAGLRYLLATLILAPFVLASPGRRHEVAGLGRRTWWRLAGLGLVMIALTQGAQFLALALAPAVTVSLLLSLTPLAVAALAVPLLREVPSGRQWLGAGLVLVGTLTYFGGSALGSGASWGVAVAVFAMLANAAAALYGRAVNRGGTLAPSVVTLVSMGIGSLTLLAAGLAVEPRPVLDLRAWAILLWLAAVNTAFAFTLWNHTLRRLSATESSVINNTMLIQIAILAWVFLGERLGPRQVIGVVVVAVGVLTVQVFRPAPRTADPR